MTPNNMIRVIITSTQLLKIGKQFQPNIIQPEVTKFQFEHAEFTSFQTKKRAHLL